MTVIATRIEEPPVKVPPPKITLELPYEHAKTLLDVVMNVSGAGPWSATVWSRRYHTYEIYKALRAVLPEYANRRPPEDMAGSIDFLDRAPI